MVDPVLPRRRVKLNLDVEADSIKDLFDTLEDIARRVYADDLTKGFSAGYQSSYSYELSEDESITHESWEAAVAEFVKRKRAALQSASG